MSTGSGRKLCDLCRDPRKGSVSLCCGDQMLCKECAEENNRLLACQKLSVAAAAAAADTCVIQPAAVTVDLEGASDAGLEVNKPDYDNELLCFLQNKKQLLPVDSMIDIVVDFYKSDEIESARKLLSTFVSDRLPKRNGHGDEKKKNRDKVADLLKVCLDPAVQIPAFKAVKLARLPPVGVQNIDLSALVQEVDSLREEARAAVSIRAELAEVQKLLKQSIDIGHEVASLREEVRAVVNMRSEMAEIRQLLRQSTDLGDKEASLRDEVSVVASMRAELG